jgi:hypothetical protein
MKKLLLCTLLTTVAAAAMSADKLEPGIWMLEVYRPDAPQDTIQLNFAVKDGAYKVVDDGGGQQFDNFRMSAGTLLFEHLDFEESCGLLLRPGTQTWEGTCPPDNELKFEDGLTITLRRPRGHVPLATAEEADTSTDGPGTDANKAQDAVNEQAEETLQDDSAND